MDNGGFFKTFFSPRFNEKKSSSGTDKKNGAREKIIFIVLSILISAFIWLFVVDPVKSITISVPIKVRGLTANKVIEGKNIIVSNNHIPQYVEVTLVGRNSYLKNVNKDSFYAQLDFRKITNVNQTKLNIELPYSKEDLVGVKVSGVNPSSLDLQLDKYSGTVLKVSIKKEGSPKPGYKVMNITSDTNIVQLSGATSVVQNAVSAVLLVDVSNATSSYQEQTYIKVVDKQGKEVEGTEKKYIANISVDVAKEFEVVPVLEGVPPEGYYYKTPVVYPAKVYLYGNSDVLSGIERVFTEPIDISKFKKDTTVHPKLVIAEGLSIESNNPNVRVVFPIEGAKEANYTILSKKFNIIGKDPGMKYTLLANSLNVNIIGPISKISSLKAENMLVNIDVSGLERGVKKVPVTINLPNDCKLNHKAEISVNIE